MDPLPESADETHGMLHVKLDYSDMSDEMLDSCNTSPSLYPPSDSDDEVVVSSVAKSVALDLTASAYISSQILNPVEESAEEQDIEYIAYPDLLLENLLNPLRTAVKFLGVSKDFVMVSDNFCRVQKCVKVWEGIKNNDEQFQDQEGAAYECEPAVMYDESLWIKELHNDETLKDIEQEAYAKGARRAYLHAHSDTHAQQPIDGYEFQCQNPDLDRGGFESLFTKTILPDPKFVHRDSFVWQERQSNPKPSFADSFGCFIEDTDANFFGGIVMTENASAKIPYMYIDWLWMSFKSGGFGGKLLKFAENIARSHGLKSIVLRTDGFHGVVKDGVFQQSLKFYQHMGFNVIVTYKNLEVAKDGKFYDSYILRKRLT